MTCDEIVAQLQATCTSIEKLDLANASGVYAVYLKDKLRRPPGGIPEERVPKNGLVYVGRSSNLADREMKQHFESGRSGSSTLRRTVGALLKDEFHLRAIPRGKGSTHNDCLHYRFDAQGEVGLTKWMVCQLEVGFCYLDNDFKRIEIELIGKLLPVYCLDNKWPNPAAQYIKSKRQICVQEACQGRH